MPWLKLSRVAFAHGDAAPLFDDVTFHLTPGWYALVGANGAGKSTLLRLLAGELTPTAGQVQREGEALLVPQLVELQDLYQSPGERKLRQVQAFLRRKAFILLVDEPTNHLDGEARAKILRELRSFRGIGVIVSHDRDVLEELPSATLRLAHGKVTLHPGALAQARIEWELAEQARRDARARGKEEVRRLAERLDQLRREAARSRRVKPQGPRDHDGRSMGARFRIEGASARMSRRAGVVKGVHARAASDLPFVPDELGRPLFVGYERAATPRIAAHDGRVVTRDDRIHVTGPNGAGKTTLIRALVASARADKILYLPQEQTEEELAAALDRVRALPRVERGRVLSVVGALGVDPKRLLASRAPSPGEGRKILIAEGIARGAWALFLDEPTNHLDLPSIEHLERALASYPGALVLASHDDRFAAAITHTQWQMVHRSGHPAPGAGVEVSAPDGSSAHHPKGARSRDLNRDAPPVGSLQTGSPSRRNPCLRSDVDH